MGAVKIDFKPDKLWYKDLIEAQTELAAVVTGMMLHDFKELLYKAAQKSGNYVANFRITVDGEAATGYNSHFTYRSRKNWYHSGSAEAIDAAKSANAGIKGIALAAGFSGAGAVVSLENEVEYASTAASQETRKEPYMGYPGDPGNPGNESALGEFIAGVTARVHTRIYVGKSTWKMYRDFDNL